jgi:regulator of replication initiation timing
MELSIRKEKEEYLKDLCSSIKKFKDKLATNSANIEKLLQKKDELLLQKSQYKATINRTKFRNVKSLSKGVIMFFVSAGIIFGAGAGLVRLAKGNVYMTNTEIYSTDTGKSEKTEGYERKIIAFSTGEVKNIVIRAYDPWVKDESTDTYKRTVRYLNVSNIDLNNAKDYLDLDLENLGYKYSSNEEEKSKLTLDDLYTESIYEVTKEEQNTNDRKVGKIEGERWFLIVFLGGILTALYCGIAYECYMSNEVFGIRASIDEIINSISCFESIDSYTSKIAELTKKIEEAQAGIDKYISENEAIDAECNEILKKRESKKILEKYQKGLELLNEYYIELNKSNALVLKRSK